MKRISYRKAKKTDLKAIIELNNNLFKEDGGQRDKFVNTRWPKEEGFEHFNKLINKSNSLCLVVEVDEKIAGYLVGYTKKVESWRPIKRAEVESMYVKEKFRGKGIGKNLVEHFMEWSKKKGVKRVLVVAFAKNEGAIKFYKREGFIPLSFSLEANTRK